MAEMITLVAPDAPPPSADDLVERTKVGGRSIRFGLLDNCKGNADHLLDFIVAGVKKTMPLASVVMVRKDNAARGASAEVLDQLARETDFVVSAMAD